MKQVLNIVTCLSLLMILMIITGCGNNINNNYDKLNDNDEEEYITFGSSTLYFGKYKAEGDLPSNFNGIITINSNGTASYIGSKIQNGSVSKVNLTGTWEVKAKSINGLQGSPDNPTAVDGITFSWSDKSQDAYGVSSKYFGNQFMGFNWISE